MAERKKVDRKAYAKRRWRATLKELGKLRGKGTRLRDRQYVDLEASLTTPDQHELLKGLVTTQETLRLLGVDAILLGLDDSYMDEEEFKSRLVRASAYLSLHEDNPD
jgi:hypothetical protein